MSETPEPNETFTLNEVFALKEFFKKEINSNRRFEETHTIEELYNLLEDRDALTSDILVNLEPKFQKFVQTQRKTAGVIEVKLPQKVVTLIREEYPNDWETLGLHLKLTKEQLSLCKTLEDVLIKFEDNCRGVSPQEMVFRLNRALKKCGKESLKSSVVKLMEMQIKD